MKWYDYCLLGVLLGIIAGLLSGCAATGEYGIWTAYLQNKAKEQAVLRGGVVHEDLPGYVFAPKTNDQVYFEGVDSAESLALEREALRAYLGGDYAKLDDLCVERWPFWYRVAEGFDYFAVPVGGGTALYYVFDSINSSGSSGGDNNSHTTTYDINSGGGDVHVGNGDSDKSQRVEQSSDYDYSYSHSESHTDGGESE